VKSWKNILSAWQACHSMEASNDTMCRCLQSSPEVSHMFVLFLDLCCSAYTIRYYQCLQKKLGFDGFWLQGCFLAGSHLMATADFVKPSTCPLKIVFPWQLADYSFREGKKSLPLPPTVNLLPILVGNSF
jgi:hypothetical protein